MIRATLMSSHSMLASIMDEQLPETEDKKEGGKLSETEY